VLQGVVRLFAKVIITMWGLFSLSAAYSQDADDFDFSTVQNSELPKTTEITKPINLQINSGKVSVTLPAGRILDVTERIGNELIVSFSGNKVNVPYTATTIKSQIIEARHKQAELTKQQNESRLLELQRLREEREAAIAREEAQKRDILVKSWSWSESSQNYYKAVGEIENESNQALSNIEVEVILRDSAGNVLETGSALANDHSLAPGDSTTFSVLIRKRSEAKTASLSFRRYGINAKKYSHRVRN
jgi:hypothetical protein